MSAPGKTPTTWDDHAAEELIRSIIDDGWGRISPFVGLLLCAIAITKRPMTTQDLTRHITSPTNPHGTWDGSCWDSVDHFTDEELAEFNAAYGDDDGRTADEVNTEAETHHRERVAEIDRYAAHYGLGPVRTCGDALDLLMAAGALHRAGDLISPTRPMPRVADAFPVSDAERAVLADMRRSSEPRPDDDHPRSST